MRSSEVLAWNPGDWYRKVHFARPSGGGAVGVVFCWCGPEEPFYEGGRNYSKSRTADFVVKPIKGSGAPVKFAEHMLKHVGNAFTLHSKPIERCTPTGAAVMYTLLKFRNLAQIGTTPRAAWEKMWGFARDAQTYLIQETLMAPIADFGEDYRTQTGLRQLLRDEALMTNMGRLFAVDAILGNGDRLCTPNTGNIMYSAWNGRIWAIDSTSVLVNYKKMLSDGTTDSWGDFVVTEEHKTPEKKDWANTIVNHGGREVPSKIEQEQYQQGIAPKVQPGFAMKTLFEVDEWWDNVFMPHLKRGLSDQTVENAKNRIPPPVPPRPGEWQQAKVWFKAGVDAGCDDIDKKLSGLNWLKVKLKYNDYVKRFGGDANLDWANLKVRRMYFKLRRSGVSDSQALSQVQQFAKKVA